MKLGSLSEVSPDPEFRSQLRQDSAFFFRTWIRSQKFLKNRTKILSHISISAVTGVYVVISCVKTWTNYGWIHVYSWSPNRGWILKFEKFPESDLKILEEEWSQNLKKWLQPPLVPLKEKCLCITVTLGPFEIQVYTHYNCCLWRFWKQSSLLIG